MESASSTLDAFSGGGFIQGQLWRNLSKLSAFQMRFERLQSAFQNLVGIGLGKATEPQAPCLVACMRGHEQDRNASCPCDRCDPGPVALAIEPDVGENEIELLGLDDFAGGDQIVDRCNHFITGVGEQIFVVEGDQGLVLDDEDSSDLPFALTEEHDRGGSFQAVDL